VIFPALARGGTVDLPLDARRYLLGVEGEPLIVSIELLYGRRSLPQNRRLWKGYTNATKRAASLLVDDCSPSELHYALKQRSQVLTDKPLYLPNGTRIGVGRSTRSLNTARFSDYMEEVSALFAGAGIDLFPGSR